MASMTAVADPFVLFSAEELDALERRVFEVTSVNEV